MRDVGAGPWPAPLFRSRTLLGRERPEAEAAVVLVRGGDHAERLAGAALGQAGFVRLGERPLQQALDPEQALARQRQRAVRAVLADGAAGPRRIAGEAGLG